MDPEPSLLAPQWLQKGGPPFPGTSAGARPASSSTSSTSQFAAPKDQANTKGNKSKRGPSSRETAGPSRQPRDVTRRSSTAGERSTRDSWSAVGGPFTPVSPVHPSRASGKGSRSPRSSTAGFEGSRGEEPPWHRPLHKSQSGLPSLRDREDFGFSSGTSVPANGHGFPADERTANLRSKGILDRDFAGSRPGTSGTQRSWLTSSQAGGGGRGPAADGAWTSRLAEAPSEISTAHLPSALISTPSPRSSVGTVHDGDSQATGASSVSPRAVEGASPTVAGGQQHSGTLAGESNGWGHAGASDSHTGQETASAGTSTAPRMADALQQAVSPLPAQQSAAERARLEQLAMRQSKQLIPMLPASSKDKAKGKHLPAGGSKGPVQAAPEGLGRTRSLPSTKKGEEPPSGPVMMGLGQLQQPRRGPVPAERQQQAAGARDNGAGAKTLDRERQRMSFFQSLRKGASNGGASSPQPPDAAVSPPEAAASPLPSKAEAAAAEQLKAAEASVPAANGHLSSIQEHCELPNGVAQQEIPERLQQQEPQAPPHTPTNAFDTTDPRLRVSAEEEAFLRSLGWTEGGDEEEGLTEEEIASFKQKQPLNGRRQPQHQQQHHHQTSGPVLHAYHQHHVPVPQWPPAANGTTFYGYQGYNSWHA